MMRVFPLGFLTRAGAVRSRATTVAVPGDDNGPAGAVAGRVCVLRKSAEAIRPAHEKIRRDAARKGNRVQLLWAYSAGYGRMKRMATSTPAMTTSATSQDALHALLREVLPSQGTWSDEEYLWLTDRCNRLIEFTDGHVQGLPMPTYTHQAVLLALYRLFYDYLTPRGGVAMVAALRMRIREGKFREPDLLLLRDRSDSRCRDRYWLGADLVVEVVSPDDPDRDVVEKRADYAEARIPEYWIVDPRNETITMLALEGDAYAEHGVYAAGDTATSRLLDGFAVDVTAVFDAPKAGG